MDRIIVQFEERLDDIQKQYDSIKEIKSSLSEDRKRYREFASSINVDFNSISRCCNDFEHSLLINCYTFTEQFFKECICFLISKNNHNDAYVNHFLNNKLSKYSPNVKLEEMEKQLKEFFSIDAKFVFNKSKSEIQKYLELLESRNRYAHSGIFDFNFDNFEDVIKVLYYLSYEFKIILKKQNLNKLLKIFENEQVQKDLSIIENNNVPVDRKKTKYKEIKNYIKVLRKNIKKFKKENNINFNDNVGVLNPLYNSLKEIEELDLRQKNEKLYETIKKFVDLINECNLKSKKDKNI